MSKTHDSDYWRKSLEKLERNPVKQPIKKEYDVRRQRKLLEERKFREKLELLVGSINEGQTRRKELTEQLSILRSEPIYEQHQSQMNAISQSISGLKEHLEKQVELKRKRSIFRKILGQYSSVKDVEDEIKKITQDINRGVCKTPREERIMIGKINKLKKLKSSAIEYEDIESKINRINQDPEYVQQQQVKDAQSAEMTKIRGKKVEADENIRNVQEQLNHVWITLKANYEQKNELLAKCQECAVEAKEVADEYRSREREYSKYHLEFLEAQEQLLREQRRLDREAQQAAEREALENATTMSRSQEVMEELRREEEAQKQKQREEAKQRRRAKVEGGDQQSTSRKKKKDEPEAVKKSEMVDVIIPYYKELQRLRACKAYLQSFMPKSSANSPTGKKKRRKPKGRLKHNLNYLQAFSEAGCMKLLPNRREHVEDAYKEVSRMLDEMDQKSQAEKDRMEGRNQKPVDDTTKNMNSPEGDNKDKEAFSDVNNEEVQEEK